MDDEIETADYSMESGAVELEGILDQVRSLLDTRFLQGMATARHYSEIHRYAAEVTSYGERRFNEGVTEGARQHGESLLSTYNNFLGVLERDRDRAKQRAAQSEQRAAQSEQRRKAEVAELNKQLNTERRAHADTRIKLQGWKTRARGTARAEGSDEGVECSCGRPSAPFEPLSTH